MTGGILGRRGAARPPGGFTSNPTARGDEARRKAESPHSGPVDIYVNGEVVVAAALDGDGSLPPRAWPAGSLVVSAGFDGDDAQDSGRPGVCLDGHERVGDDYVRAFELAR